MTVTGGAKILATDINTIETATETRIATTTIVADSSTWSNTPEVSASTVTGTLVSGQLYMITFIGRVSSDVAADVTGLRIREDAGVAGTQLQFAPFAIASTSGNGFMVTLVAEYTAVSSAAKTFTLTGARQAGTGTAHRVRGTANAPGFFKIDKVVS